MSYLPVGSNDTLSHLALTSAPETLCGKPVVKAPPTPYSRDESEQDYLPCDICASLSGGGDSILKQTEASRDCPYCEDGKDESGLACWNCGGSGLLDEGEDQYAVDLSDLNPDDLRGTKVAQIAPFRESEGRCEKCNEPNSVLAARDGIWQCVGCASAPVSTNTQAPTKTATNWTRDGEAIEDGFTVMITADQAARTPFLDYTRVAVSEKRECPDCKESHWLSKIASCMSCDGLKCSGCMESIGIDTFLGTCKKCAGAPSDLAYETGYEESYDDTARYFSYLMQEEDAETDPLFLPDTYE